MRFAFTPGPELTPCLGVTRFRLTIDGADSAHLTDHGVDPAAIVKEAYWSRSRIELFAACEAPADPTLARGIPLATDTWSWQAEIAGAETQPAPTTGSFELACPPGGGGGNLAGAGGAPIGGAGSTGSAAGGASGGTGPLPTAGSGGGGGPAEASPAEASGCATQAARPAPSLAWLVSLGLVLATGTRRRRAAPR